MSYFVSTQKIYTLEKHNQIKLFTEVIHRHASLYPQGIVDFPQVIHNYTQVIHRGVRTIDWSYGHFNKTAHNRVLVSGSVQWRDPFR